MTVPDRPPGLRAQTLAPPHTSEVFRVLDPGTWAALVPAGPPPTPPAGSPIAADEWRGVYRSIAALVAGRLDGAPRPAIIGLGGSVAAGKSTFAAALAAQLGDRGERVAVVTTDGFLRPTRDLGERAGFKGFPDTYDTALFDDVLGRLVAGEHGVTVPRYSHEVYDIIDPPVDLGSPDLVVLEGVNALGYPADYCAVRLYLDADEPDIRSWYVTRFLALIDDARTRPTSFFAKWTSLPADQAEALAVTVWEAVNLPNLEQHILATRAHADVVVHKRVDHRVDRIAVRASE